MSETKTYVPRVIIREKEFSNGNSILKVWVHAETVAAFLKEHADARGGINLGISRRRTVGDKDQTHCMWLDTWQAGQGRAEPGGGSQDTAPTPKTQPRPVSAPAKAAPAGGIDDADVPKADDVPF